MNRLFPALLFSVLLSASLHAAELERNETKKQAGVYLTDLSILVHVPEVYAREVLNDPDRVKQLNPVIQEVEHLPSINPDVRRFRDRTSVCVFIFCVSYQNILQLRSLGNRDIEVMVEPKGSDFEYGHVIWKTQPLGEQTSRISFHAENKPSFWVPPLLGTVLLNDRLAEAIIEMASKMECEYQNKAPCDFAVDDGHNLEENEF